MKGARGSLLTALRVRLEQIRHRAGLASPDSGVAGARYVVKVIRHRVQLAQIARECRAGELAELAGQMRLIRVPMLSGQSGPLRPHSRLDGADDALESRQPAERFGPESHVVAKDPLEMTRAEPGER